MTTGPPAVATRPLNPAALLRSPAIGRVVPFLLLSLVVAPVAYWRVFSTFAPYDDEGYLLISLQSFLHGGALYDDVFTQYGPAYYELFGLLFKLTGQAVTTNAGRLLVVGIWLVASLLTGVAARSLTGRLTIGLASQVVAFGALALLVAEPMHPVGLTTLLTIVVVAAVAWAAASPRGAGAVVAGSALAALVLTKINIGAFAIAAAGFAAAATVPALSGRRWVRVGAAAGFVALPLLLLSPDLGQQWVRDLALLIMCGAVALAVVTVDGPSASPAPSPRQIRVLVLALAAFAVTAVTMIVVVLALGTSIGSLVDGVLVEPSRLRDVFVMPFLPTSGALDWAPLAIAAAVIARRLRIGGASRLGPWPGLLRIAAGLAIWLSVTATWPLAFQAFPNRLLLPTLLAWIAAVPPAGTLPSPAQRFVRAFLPALAVAETLQVYPVAGTQMLAAAFVYVPVGAICIGDGWAALERWWSVRDPSEAGQRLGVAVAVAVTAALALSLVARPFSQYRTAYRSLAALPFGGATRVHLPRPTVDQYAQLVNALRTRCSTFVTEPGMNSFYLWANRRPPTGLNAGDWMVLLDDAQQRRVVDAVRGAPRPCAVRNRTLLTSWVGAAGPKPRPLVRYIDRELAPAGTFGEYELLVRRRRP